MNAPDPIPALSLADEALRPRPAGGGWGEGSFFYFLYLFCFLCFLLCFLSSLRSICGTLSFSSPSAFTEH